MGKGSAVGFGVSFRIAPGARVRASSRGIRTSVGPRGARLHVGAGRTPAQQTRHGQRAQQIEDLAAAARALATRHHEPFPPAPTAIEQAGRRIAARQAEHTRQVHAAADHWDARNRHEPTAVMSALEAAYEDNQAPAACVDVGLDDTRYAATVVMFGELEIVPEHMSALTPIGRPTIKKRTKTSRNDLYVAALGSAVLATVKEGFAAAPSVMEFRALAVRNGTAGLEPIYEARFSRDHLAAWDWLSIDPQEP